MIHSKTQHDAGLRAVGEKNQAAKRQELQLQLKQELDEHECGLCKDVVEEPRRADCGHIFCLACITDFLDMVLGKAAEARKNVVRERDWNDDGKGDFNDNDEDEEEEGGDEGNNKRKRNKGSSQDKPKGNPKGNPKGKGKGKGKNKNKNDHDVTLCPCCPEPLSVDLDAIVDIAALEAKSPLLLSASAANNRSSSSSSSSYLPDPSRLLGAVAGRAVGRRRKSILDKIDLTQFHSSSKIEALMQVGQDLGQAISYQL